MIVFLTFAIMLIVAYSFFREGLLTALTMLVNVFLAGLVAFNFWEPLASGMESSLQGSLLEGYEDSLCLFALFVITLGALRLVTNSLASTELQLPALVQQIGSIAVALLTGYLLAGFLVCMMQTLPWGRNFLGFDPTADADAPKLRRFMPPDRVWLALMHRAGAGPLSQPDATTFDPEGSFEMRYARERRKAEQ
jgi:hypothetical protein